MSGTIGSRDLGTLLAPIAGQSASGADVRYDAVYDAIRAARKVAEQKGTAAIEEARQTAAATGVTVSPARIVRLLSAVREWSPVEEQAAHILSRRSKDLQVAVWFVEALAHQRGFSGAADGLTVVRRLLEEYWDTLFPAIDSGDAEPLESRRAALAWLNDRLPGILKAAPLTDARTEYGLLQFEAMQEAGEARAARLSDGWPSPDQLRRAVAQLGASERAQKLLEIAACAEAAETLQTAADVRFGAREFSLGRLTAMLGDCARVLSPADSGRAQDSVATGAITTRTVGIVPADETDGVWERALQLVAAGQLEGLRLAQQSIETASSGRERFLRQLRLSELCIQAGMHAFAYPILDELGKTIDERRLQDWEDESLIRRTWSSLADACGPLARVRPESEKRRAEALERLGRGEPDESGDPSASAH